MPSARPKRSSKSDAVQHTRGSRRRNAKAQGADYLTPALDVQSEVLTISVVVPTCRNPIALDGCLDALVNQNFDPAAFEIIIVDNGPTLDTRAVVAKWTARTLGRGPVVGYMPLKGSHGPVAARNAGWRVASGDVIAFTEENAMPDRDWLRNSLPAFQGNAQAAWGRIVTPIPETPTEHQLNAKRLEKTAFSATNCFCLKHVLETVNGFDERFQLPGAEYADLYFRLLRYEARIVYLSDAIVLRPPTPAPWGASIRRQRNTFFDALLFKKHPYLYRKTIHAKPRWDHYVAFIALLTCLIGLMIDDPALAAGAGALWFSLTGRVAIHRLRHTSKA
ncbi:MAG TPA: glycosyltransferase, partial [Burkholderiales bacterium]|nr:glycosyltransferase [Burkholderiales bacterium]